MSSDTSWNSVGLAAVVILIVAAAIGGGYIYGRDSNQGDGNDIRIDLPDGKKR